VKVGDRILMQRNESGEWELGGEKFLLIEERHVLAVIEPEARAS
jgi:co-chaperonin GroES (HSP10)